MSAAMQFRPQTGTHHDGRQGTIDPISGGLWVPNDDGGLDLEEHWQAPPVDSESHTANLVHAMGAMELGKLANDIWVGISSDDRSRQGYLDMTAKAVDMLGVYLKQPGQGTTESPLEGMSTIDNPLLLDCCIGFQADMMGEMLPASGPAKIRNDGDGKFDPLANALETDFNHWTTNTATEYYPDTDRALFAIGLIGGIVKKVYRCPTRKRPVSETVYLQDLIVNATATDLDNAVRVTHQTKIINVDLLKLQDDGLYANVPVGTPIHRVSQADEAGAAALGISTVAPDLPADYEHTIWECYTKLKLFDDKEPSPYRITIERDSQQALEIRRNWREHDEKRTPRKVFVLWPYLHTHLGFYPLGLFHLLGNTNMGLTALWRMSLDAVMLGNFPGGLASETVGKQQNTNIRVPPGGLAPIQTNGKPIQECVMPLPFKGLEPAMLPLIEALQGIGQKLGGRAEIQIGEGTQNAPVGTVLALIEQAMKPVAAVAKRLHQAQSAEFTMLLDLFREDPQSFWRDNPEPAHPWDEQSLLQAFKSFDLVPVSDPNTPSQMHRVAKALMVFQMAQAAPTLFRLLPTARWLLQQVKIGNVDQLLVSDQEFAQAQAAQAQAAQQGKPAAGGGQNPAIQMQGLQLKAQIAQQAAQQKAQEQAAQLQAQQLDEQQHQREIQAKAQEALVESQDRAADRASRERVANTRVQIERDKLAAEQAQQARDQAHDLGTQALDHAHAAGEAHLDRTQQALQAGMGGADGGTAKD